jgi:hypothetical protein
MDKKKDSMAGMTSAQKAAVLKGKQRMNKDEMAKNDPRKTPITGVGGTKAEFDRRNETTNKLRQGNVDIGRTIARLESSKDRSARSATYRLAQMKADAKARKRKIIEPDMRGVNASKRNRKIIEPDMRGVKASKKGNK